MLVIVIRKRIIVINRRSIYVKCYHNRRLGKYISSLKQLFNRTIISLIKIYSISLQGLIPHHI